MATAAPLPHRTSPPVPWRFKRSTPAELLIKAFATILRAHAQSVPLPTIDIAIEQEQRPLFDVLLKSATQPAQTHVVGWAAELVSVAVTQFFASMTPSVFGALVSRVMSVQFVDGSGPLSYPRSKSGLSIAWWRIRRRRRADPSWSDRS